MGLRELALEAAQEAAEQRETLARAVLADRLSPAAVDALTVVDSNPLVVVFADGDGLFLSVRDATQPPKVCRVLGGPGSWTAAGEVDSLRTLGLILAAEANT